MFIQRPKQLLMVGARIALIATGLSGAAHGLEPSKAVTQYSHSSWQTDEGLPQNTVRAIAQTPDGYLWAGTEAGLVRFDGVKFRVFNRASHGQIFDNHHIYALTASSDGVLWIGTNGGGLLRLDADGFRRFGKEEGLPVGRVISVLEDRDGILWLGTYGGGLGRWIDGSVTGLERGKNQWTSNNVWTLFEDREGTLWAGTLGGGLNQLKDGPFTTYSIDEGLSSEIVSSIYEDPGGDLWLATRGGLHRFHQGSFEVLTTADGLASDSSWAIYGDRQENLWVGHSGAGVDRLHGGTWHHLGMDDGLADNTVFALLEDRTGDLWIATNDGLNHMRDGVLTTLTTAEGLAGNQVRSLLEGQRGGLWVGTTQGLSRFDGESFDNFTQADGLGGNNIGSLAQDADGTLWIGIPGGGLSRFRDGAFTAFTSRDGLLDDAVVSVLDDGTGHLWLSTSRGIFQVAKTDLEAFAVGDLERIGGVTYGRRDGLKNETCYGSQPSSLATRDGRLWFATLDGVAVVDPRRLEHTPAPAVLVEQATVDGMVLPPDPEPLPPHSRTIELKFSAPTLLVPGKIKLRHRLRGFDESWHPAGELRAARYNNLEPGNYTFEVTASDERGRWNGEVTSYAFRLQPAFYQTAAFRGACALGLVLIALGLHNVRTRQLRRRARKLSERVEEALNKLRVLRGLLPICASCKRIRDDEGSWTHLEIYIDAHSEAAFTHGICPSCADRYRASKLDK